MLVSTYIFCEGCILFQELDNTISELRVVHAQALGLVEGKQDSGQEDLMFFLQRQGKSVDNGA